MEEKIKKKLECHKIWVNTMGKQGEILYITEEDLKEYDFSGMNLVDAILPDVNFSHAQFINTDLSYSNLVSSNFYMANLTGAQLIKADADDASFEKAIMVNLKALRATFISANLRGANLTGANLCRALFFGTNLEYVNLEGADLTFASLKQCNICGINIKGAKGIETLNVDWINVGTKYTQRKLIGDGAKEWLLAAVNSS